MPWRIGQNSRGNNMAKRKDNTYKTYLLDSLKDREEAAAYLRAAREESRAAFLVALRNVAEAQGMSRLAKKTRLDRVALYRMLSEDGNPTLASLDAILAALGFRVDVIAA